MAMSAGKDDGEPMMEMNTTPLIDVMLVLLIMFIITIPIQTHAVKVDLPVRTAEQPPTAGRPAEEQDHDRRRPARWRGTASPVDEVTLRQYLDATAAMNPEPELHFQPDPPARYEEVDRTLAVIKRSGVTKLGFIGNEQYRNDF